MGDSGNGAYLQVARQNCLEIKGLFMPSGSADTEGPKAADTGSGTLEFRLQVAPSAACTDTVNFHNSDVVYGQGRGDERLNSAIKGFNESLESRFILKAGAETAKPTLVHVESTFGLDNARNVWIVFRPSPALAAALSKADVMQLIATDPVPGQGLFVLSWPKKVFRG